MWFLHYRYLMGGRQGSNVPLVGFKPNPVLVRSNSQSGNAIQELVKTGESYRIHLFGEFRIDVMVMRDDPGGHRGHDSRWGGHNEAGKPESLAYSQRSPISDVVLDNETSHRALAAETQRNSQ